MMIFVSSKRNQTSLKLTYTFGRAVNVFAFIKQKFAVIYVDEGLKGVDNGNNLSKNMKCANQ